MISYELMQQEKSQNELKTKKRGPVNFNKDKAPIVTEKWHDI